jgi:hypothetical protein
MRLSQLCCDGFCPKLGALVISGGDNGNIPARSRIAPDEDVEAFFGKAIPDYLG